MEQADDPILQERLQELEIRLRQEHLVAIERIKAQMSRTEQATQHQVSNLRTLLARQDALRAHLEVVLETPAAILARIAHQSFVNYRRTLGFHLRSERPWWHFFCSQCDPRLEEWGQAPPAWQAMLMTMVVDVKSALQQRAESFAGGEPAEDESPPRRTEDSVLS